MARPATPTPCPTPAPAEPAPTDRLVLLGLSATTLWVLGWVGIQLSDAVR
jgi:hypothetical protein